MKRLNKKRLLEIAVKSLPSGISSDAIEDVEVDFYGNGLRNDGISYWVYLRDEYVSEGGYGCQTIHEDTAIAIKAELAGVVRKKDG